MGEATAEVSDEGVFRKLCAAAVRLDPVQFQKRGEDSPTAAGSWLLGSDLVMAADAQQRKKALQLLELLQAPPSATYAHQTFALRRVIFFARIG